MSFDRLKSLIDRSFYRNLMFIKGFQANIVRKICKLIVMVNTVRSMVNTVNTVGVCYCGLAEVSAALRQTYLITHA